MDRNEAKCPFCDGHQPLARAIVPMQRWNAETLFCPEQGLLHGTIFPELYMPYERKEER